MKITRVIICIHFMLCVSGTIIGQGALVINDGAVFNLSSSTTLSIHNTDLINRGNLMSENSEVHVSSTLTKVSLGGKPFIIDDLSIDCPNGITRLATSLEVRNTLDLINGVLDLGSFELRLGMENGVILNEDNDKRITATAGGEIVKEVILNAPREITPGDIGISLSSEQDLGLTEIRRGHIIHSLPSGNSISRYFSIRPAEPMVEDLQLEFSFLEREYFGQKTPKQIWKQINGQWTAMRIQNPPSESEAGMQVVLGTDFESVERYTVGPEQDISEDLSSIPSAFTPNADGINDEFVIPWIQNYPTAHVEIFNNWGKKIYSQNNYNRSPWDGQHRGESLAPSSFFYVIRFQDGKAPLKGKISIIR